MLEILRDGVWQFIGAVIALLAIPYAYWLYLLQKRYKELAFGVLSNRALLSVDAEIAQRVQVTLDGSPVEHVFLVVLGFKNSGNTPILPDDFLRPLSIKFESPARLISCSVSSQRPSNLGAVVAQSATAITIQPLLLNPLDQVVLQILVSGYPAVEADTRIVDVSSLVPAITRRVHPVSIFYPFFFGFGLTGIFVLLASIVDDLVSTRTSHYNPLMHSIGIQATILALALMGGVFIYLRKILGPEARRYLDEA